MACHCGAVLAETVQIDTGTVVVILIILGLMAAASVAIVVFGFILAPRAGRGSSSAMGWWTFILVVEGAFSLVSVAALFSGDFTLWAFAPMAVVGGQVALYLRAKRNAGR